jgi:hypothetical protein
VSPRCDLALGRIAVECCLAFEILAKIDDGSEAGLAADMCSVVRLVYSDEAEIALYSDMRKGAAVFRYAS